MNQPKTNVTPTFLGVVVRMLDFGQFDFGQFDFGQLAEIELAEIELAEVEIGRSRNWPKSKLAEVELAELEKKSWPKSKLAEVDHPRCRACCPVSLRDSSLNNSRLSQPHDDQTTHTVTTPLLPRFRNVSHTT